MKSRNGYGEKDGRGKTSARKAQRVARSKPNSSVSESSVLLSAARIPDCEKRVLLPENQTETFYVHKDLTNSVEDFRLLDVYQEALRDLMCLYNRLTGESDEARGVGWTAADVKRLEEIRQLLATYMRAVI